jgi:hypothetical protein
VPSVHFSLRVPDLASRGKKAPRQRKSSSLLRSRPGFAGHRELYDRRAMLCQLTGGSLKGRLKY